MIYGNHSKKKGDVVQIARWDEDTLSAAGIFYNNKRHVMDEVKFIVVEVHYGYRLIRLMPKNKSVGLDVFFVKLDETNLIKVGQIY